MPRYNDVNTINFTAANGITYAVKDVRPISEQVLSFEIDKNENDLLDEVASRKETFGDFGEVQSWRVFDLNIVKLVENNFDMTKLKNIKIPV
jgi:hypothetical protein